MQVHHLKISHKNTEKIKKEQAVDALAKILGEKWDRKNKEKKLKKKTQ